jgi:hypothetical protein
MSDFWNLTLLGYITIGFIWSFFCLYQQYQLCGKKNLIRTWALNFIGWPISWLILLKQTLTRKPAKGGLIELSKFDRFIGWYFRNEFITTPITVIIVILSIVSFITFILFEVEDRRNENPVIEKVQLGKVVEGWWLQDKDDTNIRTKIKTDTITVIVSGVRNVEAGKKAWIDNHKNDAKYLCIEDQDYCWGIY